jgi:quaternary ammonium compound-resistance protein SugE
VQSYCIRLIMNQNALSWLFLLGAAVCQMAWVYSLKLIRVADLKTLHWNTLYQLNEGLSVLGPWIAYVVFGIANSVLLGMALRTIPTTTAFAVWMASSLVMIKLVDVVWFKEGWSFSELFFILLITVGIIGLKFFSSTS